MRGRPTAAASRASSNRANTAHKAFTPVGTLTGAAPGGGAANDQARFKP